MRVWLPASVFWIWALLPLSAATYYVSSSQGNDGADGLAPDRAFKTIARVNGLALNPGDEVLFFCGDVWRGEILRITRSGSAGLPIRFGSFPEGCAEKPMISGAQPISGWSLSSPNIYVADLDLGANAGLFPFGLNQLFRGDTRLAPGRWPNLDQFDAGYSTIDGQPASNRITDNQLPAVDWTGALVHIKGMRWYIVNRQVTQTIGNTLVLNADMGCWDGICPGWGYFINGHPATLDRDGEWYFEASTNRIFLYSTTVPSAIEGSAIAVDDIVWRGGIVLGRHLFEHIAHVVIENFEICRWDMNGISTPTNYEASDPFDLIIRDNYIHDVDAIGINLQAWVWNAAVGPNGWRGGHDLLVENNLIERANHFGINTFSYQSEFRGNTLRDIGLIAAAGLTGLGCGNDNLGGFCTEYGDGIRVKIDQAAYSGFENLLIANRLERIGYNGIDIFGGGNQITNNLIFEPCFSKGDCGGVRTFGNGNLATSSLRDVTITGNIIRDVSGNTDGANNFYKPLFGIGLYIDHFSAGIIASGNTIVNCTIDGILYQDSTGTATDNVLFGNNSGTLFRGQLGVYGAQARLNSTGNVLYARQTDARTLVADGPVNLTQSDENYFFNEYTDANITAQGLKTLQQWQVFSGLDGNSVKNWFQLDPGDPPLAELFSNETQTQMLVNLGGSIYLDLDQNPVTGSFLLPPFSSRVLIPQLICNPTAVVSGDTTICTAGSAQLSVALTGTAPWRIEWSDGFIQTDIAVSPAVRSVSPAQTTTYWVDSVEDSLCAGPASGQATVIVGDTLPLWVEPAIAALGLSLPVFTAHIPCDQAVTDLAWFRGATPLVTGVNPLILDSPPPNTATYAVHVTQGGVPTIATALLLVAQHPQVNLDPNGDGCNTADDLRFMIARWRQITPTDANANGIVEVRDFLYINTQDTVCP